MPIFTLLDSFELAPQMDVYRCGKCGRVRLREDYNDGEWWVCCRGTRFKFLASKMHVAASTLGS